MSYCETCGHDDLYDPIEDDTIRLGDFSDSDIEDEYNDRFGGQTALAEEILIDINQGKNVSIKIRTLLENMTGKLALSKIIT